MILPQRKIVVNSDDMQPKALCEHYSYRTRNSWHQANNLTHQC